MDTRKNNGGQGTGEEEGAMNDIEEFVRATYDDISYPITMGVLPTNEDGSLWRRTLMHPTRKDEVVGCFSWDWYVFAPGFVKECLDASKDGKNMLVAYIKDNRPCPLVILET
jgi:hypothetical protein